MHAHDNDRTKDKTGLARRWDTIRMKGITRPHRAHRHLQRLRRLRV
jgi:hypothetical protein